MKNMDFLKPMIAPKFGVSEDDIHFREVTKMNGIKRIGMICRIGSASAVPCVYIEDILEKCDKKDGKTTRWAVNEIANRYRSAMDISDDAENICVKIDKEFILDHVLVLVINAEKNSELLTHIPHRKIADLAIVCRIEFTKIGDLIGSAMVNNELIKKADINENELFDAALKNTLEKDNYICIGVTELLGFDDGEEVLYVVKSKESALNGASVLAFPEIVERFVTQICPEGKKAYILPSSIHEILIHVGNDVTVNELKQMVMSVNRTEVKTEEFLSDSVYEFDIESKELRVVA